MIGILGIAAFLTVLSLSLVITRIATIALSHTGLSHEAARFQARSAFTGTGFTTREAEKVVDHPVRRRIIMTLMIARSAGLVTIIISLILSFAGEGEFSRLMRLGWVIAGTILLLLAARSRILDQWMSRLISRAFKRWTELDTRDYASLLNLSGPYRVTEFKVREGDWLESKTLEQCQLPSEGIRILGIYRDDSSYVGVPRKDTKIYAGDTLVIYGREKELQALNQRKNDASGQQEHEDAVDEQKRRDTEQAEEDRRQEKRRQKK